MGCFTASSGPLTPAEAHALLAAETPSLGIATVYRSINAFVEAGLLKAVTIGGVTRYEPADQKHHCHFFCQSCSKAFCLAEFPIPPAQLAPSGYSVKSHELVVSGTCPLCTEAP